MNFKTTGPQSGARTMQSGHPDCCEEFGFSPRRSTLFQFSSARASVKVEAKLKLAGAFGH